MIPVRALGAVAALALTLATATAAPAADILFMRNGDRVSGRIVGETSRSIRIETPYGRLLIPRGTIERIQREGRPVEILNAPAAGVSTVGSPTRGVRLVVVVLGKTFWQAWDPRDAPADPTLRFEVRVDEQPVAHYIDATDDPDEIPRAVVNSFSFVAGQVAAQAAAGVEIAPPEVRPGRIVLGLDLPLPIAGKRKVRVAYQSNTGTAEAPDWRDLAEGSLTLDLSTTAASFVQLRQDPGRMEFSGFPRRRMKRVDTFRLDPIVE